MGIYKVGCWARGMFCFWLAGPPSTLESQEGREEGGGGRGIGGKEVEGCEERMLKMEILEDVKRSSQFFLLLRHVWRILEGGNGQLI